MGFDFDDGDIVFFAEQHSAFDLHRAHLRITRAREGLRVIAQIFGSALSKRTFADGHVAQNWRFDGFFTRCWA